MRPDRKGVSEDQAADNSPARLDDLTARIAEYVLAPPRFSAAAIDAARLCLLDSIGCALAALADRACAGYLGPVVPGAHMAGGARVLGTGARLDPVQAAFANGVLIRWLDFNDTWLAAEWGHPSDNFAALLAVADYRCRACATIGDARSVGELLAAAVCAYEIQGVLALENSFNRRGLDHVLLVRIASAALAAKLAGGDHDAVASALSNAWADGGCLRVYRHAPNAGARKSWAAADAASRGVRLGLMAVASRMPAIASAITAPQWGFADVFLAGRVPTLARPLGSHVIENILFKVRHPAEFHAQTAVEAALGLHGEFSRRRDRIAAIRIQTQEPALRIISKTGPLRNFADRDHCLQYMVAVALLEGDLRPEHYADDYPGRADADRLRELIQVSENERYSRDYLDPDKRSIASSLQLVYSSGEASERIEVEYPLGHRRRRQEALAPLAEKFIGAAAPQLGEKGAGRILELFGSGRIDDLPVCELVDLCVRPGN